MPTRASKSSQVHSSRPHGSARPEARPAAAAGSRVFELVGNTPLLHLERVVRAFPNVRLYGKAEWFNPGGSVKDRAALNIIAEARRNGKLTLGKSLLDST